MRLFSCLVVVSVPAMLAIGCLTVDADECWVNTSGGLGDAKPIPIGAGVGATTGGDQAEPPRGPLNNDGAPENPCTAEETPKKPPPQSTCEVPNPAAEGAISWSCSEACNSKCPPPGMGFKIIKFNPSEFPFVTTIQDDGTDKGGGYQEAKVNLEFKQELVRIPIDIITTWRCAFIIGMPLRTELKGKISASLAVDLSIDITESVAGKMDYSRPSGIFCAEFIDKVDIAFRAKYKPYGASARK